MLTRPEGLAIGNQSEIESESDRERAREWKSVDDIYIINLSRSDTLPSPVVAQLDDQVHSCTNET